MFLLSSLQPSPALVVWMDRSVGWRWMVEVYAGGDANKLEKAMEVLSWFPNVKELIKEVIGVTVDANKQEIARMFGGRDLILKDIMIWAMEEADSADPVQRARRASYCSKSGDPWNPMMDAVAVALAIPTSRA